MQNKTIKQEKKQGQEHNTKKLCKYCIKKKRQETTKKSSASLGLLNGQETNITVHLVFYFE